MKSLYFTDVKSFIADRTYEIKSFGYKNTKKIQDNIASLKCDIAYLHNCTKGTIQEQTQYQQNKAYKDLIQKNIKKH